MQNGTAPKSVQIAARCAGWRGSDRGVDAQSDVLFGGGALAGMTASRPIGECTLCGRTKHVIRHKAR
jgi:hypothetical protein